MADTDLRSVWPDFSARRITSVAETLGTTENDALNRIGQELIKESDEILDGIPSYARLVFSLLISLVILAILIIGLKLPKASADQVVTIVRDGIPRYHVITGRDVALRSVKAVDGSLQDLGKVLGHYALEPIPENTTIRSNQLSEGTVPSNSLQGRRILTLPIKGMGYKTKDLPLIVSLLLVPKAEDGKQAVKPMLISGVYIVAWKSAADSNWAAVAMTAEDEDSISRLLANADIYVAEDGR